MRDFFPRHTTTFVAHEAESFRRVSTSIVEMGILTGVVLRLYHALVLSTGGSGSVYILVVLAFWLVFLLGMATLHLGNFTIRHWLWRAPLFGVIEAAAESVASLGLIAVGKEPLGSSRATFHDWTSIVADTFKWRVPTVIVYAALLAGVVQLIRYLLLRHEHRGHTFHAVHTHEMPAKGPGAE